MWTLTEPPKPMERLKTRYLLPDKKRPEVAQFYVLTVSHRGVEARRITLPPAHLNQQELELHYGLKFCQWDHWFQRKLHHVKTGLTILQGEPGTGKTSYLRHLVHQLRTTHCFYYLPVTAYPMLAAPSTVDFWLLENEFHGEKQKIAIMEDAETLLMERASDNHESLSNLLNIADGFLGTFLKLHVICTVNARLPAQQAQVLAKTRGSCSVTPIFLSLKNLVRFCGIWNATPPCPCHLPMPASCECANSKTQSFLQPTEIF